MERDSDGFIFRDGLSDFDKAYFRGQVVEDDDFVVSIDYNVPSRDPNNGVCGNGERCIDCDYYECTYNHRSHSVSGGGFRSKTYLEELEEREPDLAYERFLRSRRDYSPEFGPDESFLEVGW